MKSNIILLALKIFLRHSELNIKFFKSSLGTFLPTTGTAALQHRYSCN